MSPTDERSREEPMDAAVVVGPAAVLGPGDVDAELVAVALDAVDESLAVYRDEVVDVREVWREVVRHVLPGAVDAAVLVVPSWWPAHRVEFVEGVLLETVRTVTVRDRGAGWRAPAVEFGPDVVIVHDAHGDRTAVGRTPSAADTVLAALGGATEAVIDVPDGLPDADGLVAAIHRRLGSRGVDVVRGDDATVRRVAGASTDTEPIRRPHVGRPRVVAAVGAVAVVAALTAAALGPGTDPAVDGDTNTWVLEGRIAVEVPADWPVERILTGPGSARVRVAAPDGSRVAVHVTQSAVPEHETLQATATALRAAITEQPAGVFEAFEPDAEVAGRHAVTYQEVRASSAVDWAVMVDRGVRIAVGCERLLTSATTTATCEHAIRTAHALI